MSHPHPSDLQLYRSGFLAGEDLLRVDAHLEGCASCRHAAQASTKIEDTTFEDIEALIWEAETLTGSPQMTLERLRKAAAVLEGMLRVCASTYVVGLYGRLLLAQTWLLRAAGESTAALALAKTAREVFSSCADDFQEARAYVFAAYAAQQTGDSAVVATSARNARTLFETSGDSGRAAIALNAEAAALVMAHRLREASAIYTDLLSRDIAPVLRASVQYNLALVKAGLDELEGVNDLLDAASAVRLPAEFPLRIDCVRATVLAKRGDFEGALALLERIRTVAVQRGFGHSEMVIRCNLADLLTVLGRHDEALPHAAAALDYFSREGSGRPEWHATALSIVRDEDLRRSTAVYRELFLLRREPELPSDDFPETFRAETKGAYTAEMVKELLERMRQFLESSPAHALQATTLAIDIAHALDVSQYPCDVVVKLRAQAFRDHAYVLSFMGRYPDALDFAERSKRLFEQVPLPEYDLARLALVRATVLRAIDRGAEAIRLASEAAATFLRFDDMARYAGARIWEANFINERGRITESLAIYKDLENQPYVDSITRVRLINNIGVAHRQLGELELAAVYLKRAVEEFTLLGMDTEATRSRCNLGNTLLSAGRGREAIPVLQQAWREFETYDMVADAGLTALQLAEAMLVVGDSSQVAAICRDLIARFTAAGMTSRAIIALSFLREAVATGQATPSLVRHVYDVMRELPAERPRLFASPPTPYRPGE